MVPKSVESRIKFKYFFDSWSGVAPEKKINKWLKDKNIEIVYMHGDADRVYLFYKDMSQGD